MPALSELRSRFYLTAADDGTYWNQSEVDTWLNEAQNDFALRTLCVRSSDPITGLATGNPIATLPSNTIRVLRVTFNGKFIYRENEPRLDRIDPNWMSATAGATKAFLYGNEGTTKIRLHPAPDASAVAGSYKATVVKIPVTLVADTDVSTIPLEYHPSLVFYALARAFLKDGDQRNTQKSADFLKLYEDQVSLASDFVNASLNKGQTVGFDGAVRTGSGQ